MDLTGYRAQVVCHVSQYHKDMLGSDLRRQRREFGVDPSRCSRKVNVGLGQGFEMWPSWARMVNEGKQGRSTSECGAVHVLPDEMA